MKISIRVKPNGRKNEVRELEPGKLLVTVTAPPVEGKANEKVIELLAVHFDVPKRAITIMRGAKGKDKLVEIL
jgi:uncharacterized protein (TIGR00251 family)